ncbi:hypothetical protein [Chamaesiphon sp. VAR_48_metabat_135_sub]|nr:hypothetical protein [Chamaesiphon sp. VAR_48_metabat_135_sub]
MLTDESDLQVLTALRQGDTNALGIIYDRFSTAVAIDKAMH